MCLSLIFIIFENHSFYLKKHEKINFYFISQSFFVCYICFFLQKKGDSSPTPDGGGNMQDVTPFASTTATDAQNNTYKIGYDQVTSINQNPFVEKKDAQGNVVWRVIYENTAIDGRGLWIAIDSNQDVWALFSVDGGSTDALYIAKKEVENDAFANVFLSGFGKASGVAKVAILAKINAQTGKIIKGTFIVSRTAEGDHNSVNKTNSFTAEKLGFENGNVVVEGTSAFKPASKNATQGNYLFHPDATDANKTGNYWRTKYKFPVDLSKLNDSAIILP